MILFDQECKKCLNFRSNLSLLSVPSVLYLDISSNISAKFLLYMIFPRVCIELSSVLNKSLRASLALKSSVFRRCKASDRCIDTLKPNLKPKSNIGTVEFHLIKSIFPNSITSGLPAIFEKGLKPKEYMFLVLLVFKTCYKILIKSKNHEKIENLPHTNKFFLLSSVSAVLVSFCYNFY